MKKIYSLLIGRWQPLHEGHIKLIQTVLDEGKNVCIAIRDTELSKDNPLSFQDRRRMVRKTFSDSKRVKIIKIPDIEEVVYGRNVGWGIREIRLDEETENISGTEIRRSDDKCVRFN